MRGLVAFVLFCLWGSPPRVTLPTEAEREAFFALVPALLQGAETPGRFDLRAWARRAHTAGFAIERWRFAEETYLALVEKRRRGAGAYLFRVGPALPILLQAPHADHDQGTGELALALFLAPPLGAAPRAVFLSTAHRYVDAQGRKGRNNNLADVCHNPVHLFQVATEAAATFQPTLAVIQLHGFGETDGEAEPRSMDIVVSAGRKSGSTETSRRVADALRRTLGDGVHRYPEDVKTLGATTNVQGRMLRSLFPHARFVHLELSATLRRRLLKSKSAQRAFGKALFYALAEE